MEYHSNSTCPKKLMAARDTLDIISGKWKVPIIISLTFGKKRFKEMERDIEDITPKMLSKELKDLEINGLVSRTVYNTTPVTVEYALTDYGQTLDPLLSEIMRWGENHRDKIMS